MSEINDSATGKVKCPGTGDGLHEEFFAYKETENSNYNRTLSEPQPLACYRLKEPYSGYYNRVESLRETLNDGLTGLFGPLEKEAGFIIGAYGIYGTLLKPKRKWLEPPHWLVKALPTKAEEMTLKQLSGRLKGLAAGNTVKAAAILRQATTIEHQILSRSRLHSFGGLAIGLAASQAADRLFFRHDTLGNGSAVADLLAAPMLAMRVPGNLFTKAAAVVAIELAGKALDHVTQDQVSASHLKTNSNQKIGSQHSTDAPIATPLPSKMFSFEDIENQRLNRARQEVEIKKGKTP
jgi:hypothetical protein